MSDFEANAKKVSLWDMIKNLFNWPMLCYLLSSVCKTAGSMIITFTASFYYTYVIGGLGALAFYMTISNILMFVGAFITPYVKKILKSSKNAAAFGHALYAVCLLLAILIGKNYIVFTILMSVGYMGWAIIHTCDTANYSFIGDYVEWKHGKDVRAFLMSMMGIFIKIGVAIASSVYAWGLVAAGFDANNVTEAAKVGITRIITVVPMCFFIVGAVVMLLYPLTEAKVDKLKAEIAAKKAGSGQVS
jgi:GPH family glycoside/pentoside/hexuronide:cation symporter